MNAPDDGHAHSGCEEVLSSKLTQEASPADKGNNKMLAEQDDERAELFDDESDSDLDPEDHKIIDCETT